MTKINVPTYEDSIGGITLSNQRYEIRFTHNFECDFWTFGLYTATGNPIFEGIKIVPNYILNPIGNFPNSPPGVFVADSKQEKITKNDFQNGLAQFLYVPYNEFPVQVGGTYGFTA